MKQSIRRSRGRWMAQKTSGLLGAIAASLGAIALWLSMQPNAIAQIMFAPPALTLDLSGSAGMTAGQRNGQPVSDAMPSAACAPYTGLIALVPRIDGIVWSQTVKARPTFFFQVPADLNNNIPLMFVVEDSDENEIFRRRFRLRTAAGVLAIPVRDNDLAVGENYRWMFTIECDGGRSAIAVSGTVRRVEGPMIETGNDLTAQMAAAQSYAAAGVWHEALEIAIALAQSEPNNQTYQDSLATLLTQIGLAGALGPADSEQSLTSKR